MQRTLIAKTRCTIHHAALLSTQQSGHHHKISSFRRPLFFQQLQQYHPEPFHFQQQQTTNNNERGSSSSSAKDFKLYFGPTNEPLTVNNITSIRQLRQRAAQWLNVEDLSKIRLVQLPSNHQNMNRAAQQQQQQKEQKSAASAPQLTNGEKQLAGLVKPSDSAILHDDSKMEAEGNNVQILVEMPVKIRNPLYANDPFDLYLHDVYDTQDFSRALDLYGPWKHKMKIVKFAYQEGYGPDYAGTENENPLSRVLISRDETAKSIQERGMNAKFIEMAGKGKNFELVTVPNSKRRALTTLLLSLVLGLDIVLYCYVLP